VKVDSYLLLEGEDGCYTTINRIRESSLCFVADCEDGITSLPQRDVEE
jgi:hypothetical protein